MEDKASRLSFLSKIDFLPQSHREHREDYFCNTLVVLKCFCHRLTRTKLDEKLFPRPNKNRPGKPAVASLPRSRSGRSWFQVPEGPDNEGAASHRHLVLPLSVAKKRILLLCEDGANSGRRRPADYQETVSPVASQN